VLPELTGVRIAAPDADEATLESALLAVGAAPWLDALPDELATRLGEFGQRCLRRRASAHRPRARVPVRRGAPDPRGPASPLPRDEALAAAVMDAEPGRGVLLITHRREEVALADREKRLA
jgi:hypothetical protein